MGYIGCPILKGNIVSAIINSRISKQEALELITCRGKELEQLLVQADAARSAAFDDKVRLCAICNAKSGACAERCDFCAQSVHFDTQAPIFSLKSAQQIAKEAEIAQSLGACAFSIVTSGRTLQREREIATVTRAVELISNNTDLQCCASLGELSLELLYRLRDAGLVRYHHNLETAPSFHHRIVHTHTYDDEVEVILRAQECGLSVCCGGILGMGESAEQRVELALAVRELDPDFLPLNFLDPRPGTPLEHVEKLSPEECLQIIAVFRLILPQTHIVICGGRECNLGQEQHRIFQAGADSLMMGDYLTTVGQAAEQDQSMIARAGLQVQRP